MITIREAQKQVAEIRAIAHDAEAAHVKEDVLHADVLRAVAAGSPDAQKLAQIALRTQRIKFGRYCS